MCCSFITVKIPIAIDTKNRLLFRAHSILVSFEFFAVCLLCVIIIKRWNIFVC